MGGCTVHPSRGNLIDVTRVIQVRDVPDDVHRTLSDAAAAAGMSLSRYALRELDQAARRAQVVRDNAAVVRATQAEVRGDISGKTILEVLREGRGG